MRARIVGYVRISAQDQSADSQVDALGRAGVGEIVIEQASGVTQRPQLDAAVAGLVDDDVLARAFMAVLARSDAQGADAEGS